MRPNQPLAEQLQYFRQLHLRPAFSLTVDYFDVQGSYDAIYWSANTSRGPTRTVTALTFPIFHTRMVDRTCGRGSMRRVGVLYTHFSNLNGSASNFDGAGTNAKDADQVFLYSWIDF